MNKHYTLSFKARIHTPKLRFDGLVIRAVCGSLTKGSSVLRIIVAKTLIVEFDSTASEMTAEQLYNSDSLINYLASILGIDSSKIKVQYSVITSTTSYHS